MRERERKKQSDRGAGRQLAIAASGRSVQRLNFYSFSSPIPVLPHSQAHARRVLVYAARAGTSSSWYVRTTDDASGRSLTCRGRRVSQRRRRHGQRALPSGYLRQVVIRLIGNSLCGGVPEMIGCRCVIHRARRKRASGRLTDPKVSDRKSSLARQWMICDGTGHSTRDHGEHWAPPSCVQRAFLRRAGSGRRQALAAAATGGCVSKVETDSG